MKPIVVHLRREVYESDAWKIIDWLGDMDIAKYLNESQNVCDSIRQTIYRVNLPILTHLFNRNGSFFIVADPDGPVGFTENKELLKEMQYSITLGEFVSLA